MNDSNDMPAKRPSPLRRLGQWLSPPPGLAVGVWRQARRLVVAVVGTTVILIGIVLFFTPGPAMLVIPAGLAILATEFVWARRLLNRLRASAASAANAVRGRDESPNHAQSSLWRRWASRFRRASAEAIRPFRPGFVDPYAPAQAAPPDQGAS